MASQPERDAIEDEAARVLAENPGLQDELETFGRLYDAGEVPASDVVPHETVRRRLGRLLGGGGPEDWRRRRATP